VGDTRSNNKDASAMERQAADSPFSVFLGRSFSRRATGMLLETSIAIAPNSHLLFSRSKLLVALSEKLDQTVHAAFLDLVAELLPICLDQPDAEHVQVI
jgi:hypothetical protein